MKFSRVAQFATAAAGSLGLVFASGSSANASGQWQTFTTNSNWHCGVTSISYLSQNIHFQTCIISGGKGTAAQAALVVSNKGTKVANIRGLVEPNTINGGVAGFACDVAPLPGGQRRACFAPSVPYSKWCGMKHEVHSEMQMNNGVPERTFQATYGTDCP
ncbi:hypothetical protein ACIO7M_13355 [Streptomyces toxytricini]|uniref:Secreted protein n=1 Tax=Streptomyces toxytricini TaxID=67369 RepID=A0ABW8EHH7_STRT5